jgi:ubiquinone/menaquinone biosynthesis C-methylase UbiE
MAEREGSGLSHTGDRAPAILAFRTACGEPASTARLAADAPAMTSPGFDELAARYDRWYATPVGAWADRYEVEAVLRCLEAEPGARLLDLGTGTGRYALAAAGHSARVVGVDASPAMLGIARSRLALHVAADAVELVRGDVARLPFADASFDAAVAVTSLCFVADPHAALAEVRRVLRPDGRLVLGELNRWSLWALLRRLHGLVRPTTYRAAHFRSIRELRRLLGECGFDLTHWHGLLHLPPVNRAGFLATLDPVERLGQRWTPAVGAFLVVAARRRR